jgi:hypothetical protein
MPRQGRRKGKANKSRTGGGQSGTQNPKRDQGQEGGQTPQSGGMTGEQDVEA